MSNINKWICDCCAKSTEDSNIFYNDWFRIELDKGMGLKKTIRYSNCSKDFCSKECLIAWFNKNFR